MAGALLLGVSACDDYLTVDNPTVVQGDELDFELNAEELSRSAAQNFATSYGWLIMYSSWFTGETYATETFPTRNQFGRRAVDNSNTSLNGDVWQPLAAATASADRYLVLAGEEGQDDDLNAARAALFAGFSVLFMAEHFCEGTIADPVEQTPGPRLTSEQGLDEAVSRFSRAHSIAQGLSGDDAADILNSALVGRARAHLQAGRTAEAAADAAGVAEDFVHEIPYVDDLGNRTRLGNRMWQFTNDRGSIGVAPAFRVDDPRVPYLPPDEHELSAFETEDQPHFFIQQKYPEYASPIRLASKLEAEYIAAEAAGTQAQLALIQARREANDLDPYNGPTDPDSVLTEFFEQRGREFYLEGKRLGDFRRHPDHVLHVPPAGEPYFKGGYGGVGDNTCYPLPLAETDNNPDFN